LIDIVSYKNKSIYIDDEGLLKADPQLTLLLNDTNQYLYGNVLIMGDVDEEVETLGISSKEAEQLIRDIKIVKDLISNQELMLW
jgi:arginine utilization protein RocB